MKILVISDSHGSFNKMREVFLSDNFGAVIFLGDGIRDADRLYDMSGAVPVCRVSGNCDFYSPDTISEQIIELSGKKILVTHGHKYSVKSGYHTLRYIAKKRGVDIALFGHTHIPFYEKEDGLILANPGALSNGKYAVLTIEQKNISFKHGDIYDKK